MVTRNIGQRHTSVEVPLTSINFYHFLTNTPKTQPAGKGGSVTRPAPLRRTTDSPQKPPHTSTSFPRSLARTPIRTREPKGGAGRPGFPRQKVRNPRRKRPKDTKRQGFPRSRGKRPKDKGGHNVSTWLQTLPTKVVQRSRPARALQNQVRRRDESPLPLGGRGPG